MRSLKKSLVHKNKSIYDIKTALFNLSSLTWPKTGTIIYALYSGVPINQFEECDDIEFTDRETRVIRYQNWYYNSSKECIVYRQESSHKLFLKRSLLMIHTQR